MNFAATPHAVYSTPSGELCQWVPPAVYRGGEPAYATFRYVRRDSLIREGFCLSPSNFKILLKVRG